MLEDAMRVSFKEALIIVGIVCVAFGMLAREAAGANKGLGVALIVVGVMMVAASPLGHMAHLW